MSKLRPKSFAFFLEQTNRNSRLRWSINIGIGLLALSVYWGTTQLNTIGLILALSMVANLGFALAYHSIRTSTSDRTKKFRLLKRVAFGQALLDLILITVWIHFSGGSISPFALLYVLYIGANSILFPADFLFLFNTISVFLYCGLMQVYIADIAIPVVPRFMQGIILSNNFLRNAQFSFVMIMLLNGVVIYTYIQKMQFEWQDADLQRNYLDRLHNLTKAGLEYHQTSSLYQILADETCELFDADSVYIIRWDHELGRVFSGVASNGLQPHLSRLPIANYQINMTQSVQRAGRPLVAENVFCSPYISPQLITDHSIHSLLGAPLYGLPDKHFLGALMVAYNQFHYYSPEEIDCIQQAADVAALLISRTSLYEETLHRADLLHQLANQVTSITSDLRQTTLLPAVVEVASSLLHAQRAALHLYNRVSGEIRCEFSMGLSKDYLEQTIKHFNQILGAQVLKNEAFVLVPDIYQDSRTSPIQGLMTQEKFRAYAVFALPSPKGPLGTLSLYWDEPRVISSEEITVAELFAERAGALLHNARLYEQASKESLTDQLTGLPNRRALDQRLDEEGRQADLYNRHYALLMIDLDGFKKINDTYGHPIGDSVLQQVTAALYRAVRSTDFISRYGGDEFAVILPESGLEKATFVAEKLKATLATTRLHLPNGKEHFLSASIGIAICPTDAFEHKKLLFLADERLYLAKREGSGAIVSMH
jgi:diguanylate cyclase (GGDEF)-like protein